VLTTSTVPHSPPVTGTTIGNHTICRPS
jgi:hypothetical protein